MKLHLTPGVLAFGLATLLPAAAQNEGAAEKPADKPAADVAPAPPAPPADPVKAKNEWSYGLGFRTGGQFAQQFGRAGLLPADLEGEAFLKGFLAAYKGDKPEIAEEQLRASMTALGNMVQEREKETGAKNLEAGKKFRDENAKKEGVTTLPSGVQYEILAKGGDKKYVAPKEGEPGKEFMVKYRGTSIDGKEFDSSKDNAVPMQLDSLIEGWKEVLPLMPIGSKWKIVVPAEKAYGEMRQGSVITPNSTLIFELEVTEIKDAAPDPHGGMQFPGLPGGAPGQ